MYYKPGCSSCALACAQSYDMQGILAWQERTPFSADLLSPLCPQMSTDSNHTCLQCRWLCQTSRALLNIIHQLPAVQEALLDPLP